MMKYLKTFNDKDNCDIINYKDMSNYIKEEINKIISKIEKNWRHLLKTVVVNVRDQFQVKLLT